MDTYKTIDPETVEVTTPETVEAKVTVYKKDKVIQAIASLTERLARWNTILDQFNKPEEPK